MKEKEANEEEWNQSGREGRKNLEEEEVYIGRSDKRMIKMKGRKGSKVEEVKWKERAKSRRKDSQGVGEIKVGEKSKEQRMNWCDVNMG